MVGIYNKSIGNLTTGLRAALALVLIACGSNTSWAAWSVTANTTPVASGTYTRLWTAQDSVTFGKVNDIVVDAAGNIYTTGYENAVSNSGGVGTGTDLLVAKHDSRGNLLWSTTYNQAGASYDEGIALALDSNGNVYVTGRTHNGIDFDIVTLEFSAANGNQVWADIRGAQGADPSTPLDDQPVGIVVGSGNKIYVAATSTNAQGDTDFLTVRYNPGSGTPPWSRVYDNGGDDVAVAIAADPNGNVVVLGTSAGVTTPDLATLKYDAVNGQTIWLKRYDSSGGARDDAADIAVDAAGDVYVTGTSWTGGNRDYLTLKYSGIDGSELWVHNYNSGGDLRDTASALALDPSGAYVYVTGAQIGTTTDYDLATVKYATDTGNPLWVKVDDIGSGDNPVGLAVDPAGEVYVAAARNTVGSRDMVISRYDPDGVKTGAFVYDNGADEAPAGLALGVDNVGTTTIHVAQGCDRVALRIGSCTLTTDYRLVKYGAVRPDLVVDSVTGPTIAPAGGAITVSTSVRNVKDSTAGNLADAAAFTVSMYLVPISNLNDLHLLGSRNVSVLASGASDPADSVVAVPAVSATFPEGNYYLMARADSAGTVPESDEANNDLINTGLTVQVVDPPNLQPTAVTGPVSALPASSFNVDYTIVNTRAVAYPSPFDSNLYLTSDGVLGNADDVFLGTFTVNGIGANGTPTGTVSGTASVVAPNTTPAGDYSVAIVVDPSGSVIESDKGDNQLIGSAIHINPLPDLTVTDVSGPLGAQANQTVPVSTTVLASTADVVSSFNVDLYLSIDQTISAADDIFLGQRTVTAPLLAGQTDTATISVTIPGAVAQGVYYLGAIVDPVVDPVNQPYGNVAEENESNNTQASTGTISIGLASGGDPDLVITDVTGPSSASLGQTISVDTTVENVLAANIAAPFDVGIYLSVDPQITTSDLLLGSYTLPSLLGNSVAQSQTQVVIPQGSTLDPIIWTDVIGNITIDPITNTLTCHAGNWTAGAASQQILDGDGWFEVTHANTIQLAFGVSSGAAERTDPGYATIDYAFVISGIAFSIQSNGSVLYGPASSSANDVFRIERSGSSLTFKQNGLPVFTTAVAATAPLFADVSCGGTVTGGNGAIASNGQVSIQQVTSGGTYYLGAIADTGQAITEVNEDNNSQVQTGVSGAPGGIVISVTSGGDSGRGGGAFGPYEMLLVLMMVLWVIARGRSGNRGPS